jgi:hypothetical protein
MTDEQLKAKAAEQEKLNILQFLGGIKSSLNDLNSKVIDGKLKADESVVLKAAKESIQQLRPQQHAPTIAPVTVPSPVPSEPAIDNNQLEFDFDKKYNLNDIFDKINTVYLKLINIEKEIFELKKNILEEKKS